MTPGAVLGVDAVSRADIFVRMKQVEESDVAYLFVVYFQPLVPGPKCSPFLMLGSKSEMADDAIQAKIDQIIAIARSPIFRVLIASDGDTSYNNRHRIFMQYWETQHGQYGLEQVLTRLQTYQGDLPLSDMLHLAKHFRTRFLKYLLTFAHGRFSKSIDVSKMRRILKLGAPLTEFSRVGKMRDVYPFVISRVHHIIVLFQKGGHAEAVVWLLLRLCFNAIRLENSTPATRPFMLRISFFLVRIIYESKKAGLDKNSETSKEKKITLFTFQWSIRFQGTVLLYIFAIENYSSLAIDHRSTHALENAFGFVKVDSQDANTPKK
jgi:hypothetical protein